MHTFKKCENCIKTPAEMAQWLKTNGVGQENVLSPVLFSVVMDEITNKVIGDSKNPDMKTLIFCRRCNDMGN